MKIVGGQDMVSPIKKILVKHPRQAFINKFKIKKEYAQLNYLEVPDYIKACSDYEKFLLLLKSFDIEIQFLLEDRNTTIDSIYTHDPCIVCDKGIILCNMGKESRVNEPLALKKYFESADIPILGKIEVPDSEYKSMGCNVLTVEPKKVIMVDGNPKTKSRLESRGVHVFTYDGSEISLKGAGGPTCLTKPFLRATSY